MRQAYVEKDELSGATAALRLIDVIAKRLAPPA
jgi:hypothetical protein